MRQIDPRGFSTGRFLPPDCDFPARRIIENQFVQATELTRDLPVFIPDVDIYEQENAILVLCDMPGVDRRNIDVTLANDVLTLTGVQDTADPEGAALLYRGYTRDIFQRSFTISADVDREKINARISQGFLEVALPKAEEAKPRKTTVSGFLKCVVILSMELLFAG